MYLMARLLAFNPLIEGSDQLQVALGVESTRGYSGI